jgi:hypothetical protein
LGVHGSRLSRRTASALGRDDKLRSAGKHVRDRDHWRFYDCMVDPDSGRYLSEDYAFCRLWRDIGGKVWVDLECKLNHLGQHMYRGDLAESLRVQGRW